MLRESAMSTNIPFGVVSMIPFLNTNNRFLCCAHESVTEADKRVRGLLRDPFKGGKR